jgi:thiol-disulfide isomerase/thioredoxin
MKLNVLILAIILALTVSYRDNSIPKLNFNQFENQYLHRNSDTLYVINFWATWCKPCVKELPNFEQINEKYKTQKVKVILVSLDFAKEYESTLLPFVQKRNLKSEIILLDDPDSNNWIDKVNTSWSGAIPATLVYSRNSRDFYEQSFNYEQLDSIVKLKTIKK